MIHTKLLSHPPWTPASTTKIAKIAIVHQKLTRPAKKATNQDHSCNNLHSVFDFPISWYVCGLISCQFVDKVAIGSLVFIIFSLTQLASKSGVDLTDPVQTIHIVIAYICLHIWSQTHSYIHKPLSKAKSFIQTKLYGCLQQNSGIPKWMVYKIPY